MENKVCDTRVVPFVRYEEKIRKGRVYREPVDNFSIQERKNISCLPKMFKKNGDNIYIEDMPLTFNGGTGIRYFLCYVFNDLNSEEQAKFFDRSIVIPAVLQNNVKADSKKTLGRRKPKER